MSIRGRLARVEEALASPIGAEARTVADSALEFGLIPPSEFEAFAKSWPGFVAIARELREATCESR